MLASTLWMVLSTSCLTEVDHHSLLASERLITVRTQPSVFLVFAFFRIVHLNFACPYGFEIFERDVWWNLASWSVTVPTRTINVKIHASC
ncbi:hypothetical protein C468_16652 [Halorubrum kocurii JCM 14978]|uniref:Uncharacterized protein n=1 Tax=Halorubrum kocurii JCM 14978 TaxID=1230456 RepID=M0NKJ0_9EURY|nr:hypothetical protein C468_16652 [Halorubrum kocurii JCM 14978]